MHYLDGKRVIDFPSGIRRVVYPDGRVETEGAENKTSGAGGWMFKQ